MAPGSAPSQPVPEAYAVPTPPGFDLDFPGGTPGQLVEAIRKASGGPLNAIIPDEYAQQRLPALKMKGVNVVKLFEALQNASIQTVPVITSLNNFGFGGGGRGGSTPSYSYQTESYGFKTQGPPSEDSIWYFKVDAPKTPPFLQTDQPEPNVCRFYQLAPFLQQNYKVEDITTAIETGWKMLGVKPLPTLNFHKETKLLIAVGEPGQLSMIDHVLQQLGKPPGAVPAHASTPAKPEADKP